MGGVASVGNLTPGISNGCRILHSWPNSSDTLSAKTEVSVALLSVECISSWAGSLICLSEMCSTQVLGQQVALAVGLEGDPLGKKVLGLLVSVSGASASGISGVIGILEGITTSFSFLSDEVTIGSSLVVPLLHLPYLPL